MKIISGNHKNRKIEYKVNKFIRPTTERIKKMIFDILQFKIENQKILDLYSGCGQIGIEALSFGADIVYFVENDAKMIKIINNNINNNFKDFESKKQIIQSDVEIFLKKNNIKFNIIFIDPPFKLFDLLLNDIKIIINKKILMNNGFFIIRTHKKNINNLIYYPFLYRNYEIFRIKICGNNGIIIYKCIM